MKKTIWNLERCLLEKEKYNNDIREFRKNAKGAYNFLCKNYLLNKVFDNIRTRWNYDLCKEEALKYNCRKDFMNKSSGGYNFARVNNILDDVCSHMTTYNIIWDYQSCKNEALKYDTRKKFEKGSRGAYNYARKHNILNEICIHMKKYCIFDRMIYGFLFSDNSIYIGLTYNLDKRIRNHFSDVNSQVYKYKNKIKEEPILLKLTNYIDYKEAQILEKEFIKKYKKEGYNILNSATAGNLGGNIIKWTYENCKLEAFECLTRKEFQNKNESAYQVSLKNGWINEFIPLKLR